MGVKERQCEDIWKKANEKRMKIKWKNKDIEECWLYPIAPAYQNSLDEWLPNTPFEQHSSLEESSRNQRTEPRKHLVKRQKSVVYKITCKCKNAVYVAETSRLLKIRMTEHKSKVRFQTNEDIKNGRLRAAKEQLGKEDGGLARHSVDCKEGIGWENPRVISYRS